ncbi:MAG: lipoyl(octanoyl) transferase LipB [Bacteroidota bacterium]
MTSEREKNLLVVDVGRTSYQTCWNLQRKLVELRASGSVPDLLLLTEHPHVYTIGKTGDERNLLVSRSELAGVPVIYNDRGGDITYHGPGQLVGYPILDLNGFLPDLARYLRGLEEVVMAALKRFSLQGSRMDGYTGVWLGDEKICAIGIKTTRWITMHGFALNVNTDLSYFAKIIPCGISDKGITSMEMQLGGPVRISDVASAVVSEFVSYFGFRQDKTTMSALLQLLRGREANHAGQSGEWLQLHGIHEVTE